MEWYVDAANPEAVRRLRWELSAYLESRADDGSDVAAASLVYSELVANVHRHVGGAAWIRLDWTDRKPVLTVRDHGPGFTPEIKLPADPEDSSGRGLYLVHQLAGNIEVSSDLTGASVSVELPVFRSPTA